MMQKLTVHAGIVAPLLRDNIDTDAIIPSREMKRVSKLGLGEALFSAWRYADIDKRTPNPDFVLNQSAFANTSIILSGQNFGCGSSREHAVWALKDFGIRCLIAVSFGSIFARNCVRNGILTIELAAEDINKLNERIADNPQSNPLTIDLPSQRISLSEGLELHFDIIASDKNMLVNGLDQISLTGQLSEEINAFQKRDRLHRPWLY